MRVATWNVERPKAVDHRKNPFLLSRIAELDADIWVLTETHDCISPGPGYTAVSTTEFAGGRPGERKTTIWSRHPARPLPTFDSAIATCAEVQAGGASFLVYGTVIPYHANRGPTGAARNWEEHHRSIPLHGEDWRRLRSRFPDHRVIVAGDFNQSRDGRRYSWGGQWYGTAKGRDLLTRELEQSGLVCVTEDDLVAQALVATSVIDHICLDRVTAMQVVAVGAWEPGEGEGVRLSDHSGVYVDLHELTNQPRREENEG